MLNIDKIKEFDFKKVFGKNKKTNEYFEDIWSEKYPIFSNKDIRTWIIDMINQFITEGKEAGKFSCTGYLNPLQAYCLFNKVEDPSELLKETEIDERNSRVMNFLQYLLKADENDPELKRIGLKKKPSEVSVKNMIQSRIKSFYSNRGLNISVGMKTAKSGANKNEILLDKEMIKLIQAKLETANYRLINKLETQTGLRINDVLEEITMKNKYKIELYKEHYYIKNFDSQKEKVKINFLFFTQELTDTLMATTGIQDLTKLDLSTLFITRNGKRISQQHYLARIKRIAKDLEMNGNLKTHAFRKYFASQLSRNLDLDPRFYNHLEGREASYRDQVYDNNIKKIDWFYQTWLKLEEYICVDCITVDKTNEEVLKLKEDNLKLNKQVDTLLENKIKDDEEREKLKDRLSKLEEGWKEVMDKILKK